MTGRCVPIFAPRQPMGYLFGVSSPVNLTGAMEPPMQDRRWKRVFGQETCSVIDLDADSDRASAGACAGEPSLSASGEVEVGVVSEPVPAAPTGAPPSRQPHPRRRQSLRRGRRTRRGGPDREIRRDVARAWVQLRVHGYAWPGRRQDLRMCRSIYGKAALARMVRHLVTHSGDSAVGSSWSEGDGDSPSW